MIVVMHQEAPEQAIEGAISWLVSAGYEVHRSSGQTRVALGVVGPVNADDLNVVREFDGVDKVIRVSEPFRLASRHFRKAPTTISGEWGTIGGPQPWIAIEPVGGSDEPSDDEQRGSGQSGSAVSAQGSAPGFPAQRFPAGKPFDAAVTRRRVAPGNVGSLACLSLHAAPQQQKYPVLFVLRPPSAGADAWISLAEKELQRSENAVALLEAGGEYPSGARTLEVAAIARAKLRTHLPIVVDVPSVAQQTRYCVPVASAAIGAGADGVILRVWVGAGSAQKRAPAALTWAEASELAAKLRAVAEVLHR